MSNGEATALLFVRHGQSTWNLEQRWQGQADPPLSDHGRDQAYHAASSIGAVDAIVTSPQVRAVETATIISEQVGVGPVLALDDLRERNAGIWSGLTTTEIEAAWPGWIEAGRRPEGWESDEEVLPRALAVVDAIVAEYAGATLLVVSHGGVIVTLEEHLLVRDGRIPNLHGRLIEASGVGLRPGNRLELVPPEMSTGGGRDRV
ncbi:MAG: histidine phosphatase family protein [Acidimicrobiia bacterium]|nr:histidine phosphatase family protein [Acidimicrobiia bacterium]